MTIDTLTQLSITLSNTRLAPSDQLKQICLSVEGMITGADRVSLWKFTHDKSAIECIALFDQGTFSLPENLVLTRDAFPEYFAAILQSDFVRASDARHHPDTRCFNTGYFDKLDIYSLLDYVFHHEFAPFGIICCESVGRQVEWMDNDLDCLKRTARIVSVFSYMDKL
ncbi:hypothetical protein DRW07_11140 [Alteromonas sediminis]|uniref:GAF domain-containing protein n=1 Tax=Alteromonas sediminis TaxID=2259342 RepID=A0A3N5Y7A9_9ALTE|nr:hypothetical protein [Alteromonas sediminis]RPJ66629.1 hypothetical protein DRW07_11140 [Alteromonas sediminis]